MTWDERWSEERSGIDQRPIQERPHTSVTNKPRPLCCCSGSESKVEAQQLRTMARGLLVKGKGRFRVPPTHPSQ
jgi:hypothetical protein